MNKVSMRRDAADHKRLILEAAAVVFSRDGYDVPLDVVIREAGVGRGTLYRHFPTRLPLAMAVMELEIDKLLEVAREMQSDSGLLPMFLARRNMTAALVLTAARNDVQDWKSELVGRFEEKIAMLYRLIIDNALQYQLVPAEFGVADLKLLRAMVLGAEQYFVNDEQALRKCVQIALAGVRPTST